MSNESWEEYDETTHHVFEYGEGFVSDEDIERVSGLSWAIDEDGEYYRVDGGFFVRYEGENGEWYQSAMWEDLADAMDDVDDKLDGYGGGGFSPATVQMVFVSFNQ